MGSNFTYFEGGGDSAPPPLLNASRGIFGVNWIGNPKSMQKYIILAFEKKIVFKGCAKKRNFEKNIIFVIT